MDQGKLLKEHGLTGHLDSAQKMLPNPISITAWEILLPQPLSLPPSCHHGACGQLFSGQWGTVGDSWLQSSSIIPSATRGGNCKLSEQNLAAFKARQC